MNDRIRLALAAAREAPQWAAHRSLYTREAVFRASYGRLFGSRADIPDAAMRSVLAEISRELQEEAGAELARRREPKVHANGGE